MKIVFLGLGVVGLLGGVLVLGMLVQVDKLVFGLWVGGVDVGGMIFDVVFIVVCE